MRNCSHQLLSGAGERREEEEDAESARLLALSDPRTRSASDARERVWLASRVAMREREAASLSGDDVSTAI
jgi:hypothetical protein